MRGRPKWVVTVCLVVAIFVGYFVSGGFGYQSFIGLAPSAFPAGQAIQGVADSVSGGLTRAAGGIVWTFGSLLAVALVTFFWVRWSVRSQVVVEEDPSRRSFLTGTIAGAGAALGATALAGTAAFSRMMLGVGNQGRGWSEPGQEMFAAKVTYSHPTSLEEWDGSRIQSFRRLGRTNFEVSDISLGTGRISGDEGERVARLALDRGVNYFDTAPDYAGSGSEQAMGRAIRGVRDQLFIATKFCTPVGHLPAGTPVADYVNAIEGSLDRLGTDYVDLIHIHSCDSVERLLDPNVHEAFDRLREQGKARFIGFSSHTPRLAEVANASIESGRFDVMMLAYHHGIWPEIPEIIERARVEADMGVVAMKTLKGARHRGLENFQPWADSFSQASLKWALSNPNVSSAVVSFFELQHVNEFLFASGQPFERQDAEILRRYDSEIAGTFCAPHCGACLDSCPENVPIADVLRHRMYFEDYGWEKVAIEQYSRLETNASACEGCSAPCLGSCPLGIDISERAGTAHRLLTLS